MNPLSSQWHGVGNACMAAVLLIGASAHGQLLKWSQRDGYREAELAVPAAGKTGFTLLRPEQTEIFFTNTMSYARSEANQNLLNGCGVAAGDFDGDGLCDLYFANTDGPDGLFRNTGQWRFQNASASAGISLDINPSSRGVVFADVNGDGWLDLLVGALGTGNKFFLNLGQGRFTNATAAAGLSSKVGTHSLALADVDGDGDLDLYVANYGELSILRSGGSFSTRMVNGKPQIAGRWARRLKLIDGKLIELGEPDAFYLNDGKGRFSQVPWTSGTFLSEEGQPFKSDPYDMGLSVMFRDIDGDGAPDIYVCNDFQTPDRIWLNDGKGQFRAMRDLAVRSTPHFSMGVDFADIDRDGHDDFFVGDMLSRKHRLRLTQVGATNPPPVEVGENWDKHQIRQNTLQVNRGDGTYANLASFAGLAASDWSWSVVFVVVDLDGYEDLLVSNAHGYDTQDLDMQERVPQKAGNALKNFPSLITPNYLFRNRGDRTFEEIGARWGFDSTNVSHGIALADLDNDGDLDVVVSCLWQAPLLYRNESTAPRVAVRLRGGAQNTRGIGAKIRLLGGAVPMQSQEMQCGGRYLSADDNMRVFAAGSLTNEMTLEVTWRSGRQSFVRGIRANRIYEVNEAGARPSSVADRKSRVAPLFVEASSMLNHTNSGNLFHDFDRQPLLPRSFSRLGPGIAWIDLDGDTREELVIGDSAGGRLAIFSRDGQGRFKPWAAPALAADLTALIGWVPAVGRRTLLAGQSNARHPEVDLSPLAQFEIQPGSSAGMVANTSLAGLRNGKSATGPVAVADYDGDGDLDIFVGGRLIPGRYPEAASSQLLRNNNGSLQPDTANNALLKDIGLVSAAVFTDLTGDGLPELVLACEWGSVKIFKFDGGKLSIWNPRIELSANSAQMKTASTLGGLTGWWTSVAAGDFDGDGRLDLVAGNWGLNSSYHSPSPEQPLQMWYGDFDNNGSVDLLETEIDEVTGQRAPKRDLILLSAGWPELRTRFASHKLFSIAGVPEVLGSARDRARTVEVVELASMLFLNRGDHFEASQLPGEAQYAPVFGMNVADFDGDGREDVFLAQNFFSNRPEEPRLDAGRGVVLRGDGTGKLKPMTGLESGVMIYGEQRGSAVCDYDEDGRTDLVVTQNGAATRMFRNSTAKPGLRVRLAGTPLNPDAIGASVALVTGSRRGPVREVRAGSGYWSQDSATMVLATTDEAAQLWVRWPGGKVTTSDIPHNAREISASQDGKVTVRR